MLPFDAERRSTVKYWVDPLDLMRVKAEVIKHLPILIYGQKNPVYSQTLARGAASGRQSGGGSKPAVANGSTTTNGIPNGGMQRPNMDRAGAPSPKHQQLPMPPLPPNSCTGSERLETQISSVYFDNDR